MSNVEPTPDQTPDDPTIDTDDEDEPVRLPLGDGNSGPGAPPDEPQRAYSYSPVVLLTDVIAVLKMHGVNVEMSAYERGGKPQKAAKKMLKSLHVHAKLGAMPKVWWLRGTYGKTLLPIRPVAD